jgi:hypothetical protein
MHRSFRVLLLLPVLSLASACTTPAGAQYLYLDTDGDGVHTSADALAPMGPTDLDVWISTGSDRDGGIAYC